MRATRTRAAVPVETIRAAAYRIPTDAPEADGTLAWDSTTLILVQVAAAGQVGTGWTYGDAACAEMAERVLAPVVVGTDARRVGAAWTAMVAELRNRGRVGAGGMALSAVDCALWDLKARLLQVPLHLLLGGIRDEVPVYASGGFTTYDAERTRAQLGEWTARGVPRVKIKIGEDWGRAERRDLMRIALARETIGPSVELYVDANGAYTAAQAVRIAERFAEYDVRWFEEPVSSDDLSGLRTVRDQVTAEVAAGEYGWDLATLSRMCQAEAVGCLQVDVTRCGGITEFLRVAAMAAAHGLEVSGHCAPQLHAPVLAAVPNARHLEWFHDHVRIESMLFDGALEPTAGVVRPSPERPGHGLDWLPEAAERWLSSPS